MWRINDIRIEDQWFLEGIWRQYTVKKIMLKFQGNARWKNASKEMKTVEFTQEELPEVSTCPKPWTLCMRRSVFAPRQKVHYVIKTVMTWGETFLDRIEAHNNKA
jgi:hypothetical protein